MQAPLCVTLYTCPATGALSVGITVSVDTGTGLGTKAAVQKAPAVAGRTCVEEEVRCVALGKCGPHPTLTRKVKKNVKY